MALLGTASEQYHQPVAVPAEVNSIAGAKVDSVFKNTGTKTLNIREVALLHAIERRRHFYGNCYIQVIEPADSPSSYSSHKYKIEIHSLACINRLSLLLPV